MAELLAGLAVGLTNTAPIVGQNASEGNYSLCARYSGTPTTTFTLCCGINSTYGRYVIIQSSLSQPLDLAEVVIYGYLNGKNLYTARSIKNVDFHQTVSLFLLLVRRMNDYRPDR